MDECGLEESETALESVTRNASSGEVKTFCQTNGRFFKFKTANRMATVRHRLPLPATSFRALAKRMRRFSGCIFLMQGRHGCVVYNRAFPSLLG